MKTETIEKRICHRLVSDILAAGHLISVHDGEAFAVRQSDHYDHIVDEMRSTDEDTLIVSDKAGNRVGAIVLIYGNGTDVISDHTDKPEIDALIAGAMSVADKLEYA